MTNLPEPVSKHWFKATALLLLPHGIVCIVREPAVSWSVWNPLADHGPSHLAGSGLKAFEAHYNDVIMSAMVSQFMSLTIVYSTVYSGTDQRKHQSFAPLAYVWGIHWWPVNSRHKAPVTRKMFPFDDVIMQPTLLPMENISLMLSPNYTVMIR